MGILFSPQKRDAFLQGRQLTMLVNILPRRHFTTHTTAVRLSTLPQWRPRLDDRILIFAPHPDDETLATGGVIFSTLNQLSPNQMQVIIATNGDASRLAAMTATKRPPSHRRLRDLAARRQQESLNALQMLNLGEEQVQFWGFPDRGLQPIWQRYWDGQPYQSRTTGYQAAIQAYHAPQKPYTAAAILELILQTLLTFHPTVIFMPHPEDAHPDHRSLGRFILLAATMYQETRPSAQYELLAYPMWLQAAPLPKSIRLHHDSFHLPRRFTANSPEWLHFPLPPNVRRQKAEALQCYHSQRVAVGGLLRAAAKSPCEVFVHLKPLPLDLLPAAPATKSGHSSS